MGAAATGSTRAARIDVLRAAAAESDGVIHLAVRHDIAFTDEFDTAVASDLAAIEAFGEALGGTDKPLAMPRVSPV
jgi:hypothetical protein